MTTMPAEITYGHVTGRFIAAWTDGPDTGRMSDPRPLEGLTVKITPKVQARRLAGASPVLVATMPVTCKVDADGALIDEQGNPGVWLVTGVYGVSYTHPAVAIRAHDIEVTDAHTEGAPLDLVTAMPPGGPVLTASQYAELSARIDGIVVEAGAVSSVNGKTGAVTLSAADVGALPSTYTAPAPSWPSVTGKPSTFTPATHNHAVADVTGLQAALDGKQPAGSYAPTSHVHTIANVTGLQAALDGKQAAGSYAAASHVHAIADVTGLQTALDTAGAPQTLSLSGQNLSLSGGGGSVTLPSGGGGGGVAVMGGLVSALEVGEVVSLAPMGSTKVANARPVGATPTRMDLMPFTLGYNVTVDRLAVNISTSTGAAQARFAIYASNNVGHPDALVWDSGNLDASTTGVKTVMQTVTLPKGVLWLCGVMSNTNATYSGWAAQEHTSMQGSGAWPPAFYQPRGYASRLDGPDFIANGFPASIASLVMTRDHDEPAGAPVIIVKVTGIAP